MPLSINDAFDLPTRPSPVRVALEPARSALQSLLMLTHCSELADLPDWVFTTFEAMTPEERQTNDLVMLGLHYAVMPAQSWNSFPAYLNHLAAVNPETLVDQMLSAYERMGHNQHEAGMLMDRKTALASADNYLAFLYERFSANHVDEGIEREVYRYLQDLPALQRLVVDHLSSMWRRYLSSEWERVQPTLQVIANAYRRIDLSKKTIFEAGQLITGQNLNEGKWARYLNEVKRVIFVPHPHVGPYVPKFIHGNQEVIVFFKAQLPDWMDKDTPELTRTEINLRLSALADDTRLRILRAIAESGELRSQSIMDALEISQSAASRHLSQLSAAGFITERRCDGAKCYALNPERVTDTLQAIASFLLVQERIGP